MTTVFIKVGESTYHSEQGPKLLAVCYKSTNVHAQLMFMNFEFLSNLQTLEYVTNVGQNKIWTLFLKRV